MKKAEPTKRATLATFNILKSIMDYRARELQSAVDAGERAVQEETEICARISALQQFVISNRYDPSDAREAEQDLEDCEFQAGAIRQKIIRGRIASAQLSHVHKFNRTYNAVSDIVANSPRLQDLKNARAELETRLARLDNCIDACEINMTPNVYSPELAGQSAECLSGYTQEYAQLTQRLQSITSEIRRLESR